MKNQNCTHKNFWNIYKIINFNRIFSKKNGIDFKCNICDKNCNLKWKGYNKMCCETSILGVEKNTVKKYFTYFLWMLLAIILIYLSVVEIISHLWAIVAITVFHFGAMWYIVNSDKLEIKCKKNI